jgi:hypothetical protein
MTYCQRLQLALYTVTVSKSGLGVHALAGNFSRTVACGWHYVVPEGVLLLS